MTAMNLVRDVNGFVTYGIPFSDVEYSVTLPVSSAIILTVPNTSKNWLAIFSYEAGSNVWVANNFTATGPAGATLVATNSSRNPVARSVKAGDVLSIYTDDTGIELGIEFYAL